MLKRSALLCEGPLIEEAHLAFKSGASGAEMPPALSPVEARIDRGRVDAESEERERMLRALAETRGNGKKSGKNSCFW